MGRKRRKEKEMGNGGKGCYRREAEKEEMYSKKRKEGGGGAQRSGSAVRLWQRTLGVSFEDGCHQLVVLRNWPTGSHESSILALQRTHHSQHGSDFHVATAVVLVNQLLHNLLGAGRIDDGEPRQPNLAPIPLQVRDAD